MSDMKRGRGRPRLAESTIRLDVRLPSELHAAASDCAEADSTTVASLTREALSREIARRARARDRRNG